MSLILSGLHRMEAAIDSRSMAVFKFLRGAPMIY